MPMTATETLFCMHRNSSHRKYNLQTFVIQSDDFQAIGQFFPSVLFRYLHVLSILFQFSPQKTAFCVSSVLHRYL